MVGWRHATLLAVLVALAGAQGAWAQVLVIDGAGDGHGVGMSQTGAAGLAAHGYSARAILTHYYTGTTVGHLAREGTISVLLQSHLRSVVFSGATRAGERPLYASRTYIATSAPGGRIALQSARGHLLAEFPAPLVLSGAAPIRFVGAASSGVIDGRFRGRLVVARRGSRLDLINRVGVEAYLRGVVPAESPSYWPLAELEAQAIAARSYALASPPQHGFDLYGDTRSQEYGGYDAEAPATDAAVAATAGEIVTYHGRAVVTYYFAASGGATEDAQYGLPGTPAAPYLRGVLDPYDATRFGPITLSMRQADHRLRRLLRGTLRAIEVSARGVSPRIVTAKLVGSAGTTTVTGTQLAAALHLQSTWACFALTSSLAKLAPGWDRACARPRRLRNPPPPGGPTGAVGPTGPSESPSGGTVAPSGTPGTTGATGR